MRGRHGAGRPEPRDGVAGTAISTPTTHDTLLLRLCASAQAQADEAERLGRVIDRASRLEAARLVGLLGRAQRSAHTLAEQAVMLRPRTLESLAALAALAIRLADRDEDGRCAGVCTSRCLPIAVLEHVVRLEHLGSVPPQTRA
ncbi:hypothetical protein ACI6QG_10395 [Roseococcus sp. DSY-14]|uniref:hypothetical protein n=1 Tax=Roseococcus sp. DSY-14 TaxID=3369650 RepID=UPI00387B7674